MDGYIHYYELESGKTTRHAMFVGYTFKGAGALDPRGYPIMYVGSGVHSVNGRSRSFIINLIDNTVMYEFGHNDGFADRGFSAFDSSPLVSAETDQLIYPGENGVLYIIHLYTNYNEATGELSINPDNVVKWKYMGVRSSGGSYWLGMEDSAVIINHYLFIGDNGGLNISFRALQNVLKENPTLNKSIDGFTPEQRFFLSWATVWAGNARPEFVDRQIKTDPHSPAEARVNGALPQIDAWYKAFNIKKSDKLFVPQKKRAQIW